MQGTVYLTVTYTTYTDENDVTDAQPTTPGDKQQWTQTRDSSRPNFRPSLKKRRLRHRYTLKQTSSQFELSKKEIIENFRSKVRSSGSYSFCWYAADSNAAQPFAIESSIEVKERAGFTTLRRPCLPSRWPRYSRYSY